MDRYERARQILRAVYPDVSTDEAAGYYTEVGDIFTALAHASLFWPRLVEVDEAVFLAVYGNDEAELVPRYRSMMDRHSLVAYTAAWRDAVASFNFIEIGHLFRHWIGPVELGDEVAEVLGEVLLECWSARLKSAYPSRIFSIALVLGDESMFLRIEIRQEMP